MSNRSLLIVALVALAFCTYLYFKGGDPGTRERELEAERLVILDPDKVLRVELTNPGGTYVFQKNDTGRWDMEKPIKFPVDPSAIGTLLSEIEAGRKMRVIQPGELPDYQAALQKFGLKDPRITVRLQTAKEVVDLQIGGQTPSGNLFYALIRDPKKQELAVVEQSIEGQLMQNLDLWRNPQVFDLEANQITALLLHRGTLEVEVLKAGPSWNITKPLKEAAVPKKIQGYLGRVSSLRAKNFVSESGADLAQYGLNTPAFILEVKEGEKSQTLRVGTAKADDPEQVYAQWGDRPAVFTLERKQADEIAQLLDGVRSRSLFGLDAGSQVLSIEITQGGSSILLQRERDDDKNWLVKSDGVQRKANTLGARDIIQAMNIMEVQSFYSSVDNPNAEYGLQKPAAIVKVKGYYPEEKDRLFEQKVIFGAVKDKWVYAQSSALPFVVDGDKRFLDALPKGAAGWFDRSLGFPPADEMTELVWTQGTSVLSLKKDAEGKWVSDPAGKNIDQTFLKTQLAYLSNLRAVRWTGKAVKKDFVKPWFLLEIKAGERSRLLILGPKQSDGTTLGKMEGDDYAFVLSDEDAQKVMVRPVIGEP